jgi:hypothetical protein
MPEGVPRAVQGDGAAIDADESRVGCYHARQELDERGLAGSVVSEQAGDFLSMHPERDILQRDY